MENFVATGGKPTGDVMNQWVSQHLPQPLEIRGRTLHYVLSIFLGLFFLILGVGALTQLFTLYGFSAFSIMISLGSIGLVLLLHFLGQREQKKTVKTIASSGVVTRGGRTFEWPRFTGVKFITIQARHGRRKQVHRVELMFEDGSSRFGPGGARNAEEIMKFIHSLPGDHIESNR
ncbi:MAG: hypothetical protein QOJ64_2077 [Acidobacteriota bacterium]|jgi:hypothetical protein|nr:hypothetical protein [Acidobacteriota bacterium]